MTRRLGHQDITARHYVKDDPIPELEMPRLTAHGYALTYDPKAMVEGEDDPDFSKNAVYYIIVDLPSSRKAVEIVLTIEQLSEALLDTIRHRNRPKTVDNKAVVLDENELCL